MSGAALAAIALSFAAVSARAGPTDRTIVAALPGVDGSLERAILIGRSAEIFEPVAGGFSRRTAGGVGPDVTFAVRGADGSLWALPRRAPLFKRDPAGVWHAVPLGNRGPIVAAREGGRLAVGRHIYAPEKGGWRRLASAPAAVVQLASRGRTTWVLLGDGRLLRLVGDRLATIPVKLAAAEAIAWLGADDRGAIVSTSAGRWLRVAAAGVRPLATPAELATLVPEVAAATREGLVVAGSLPGAGEGARRHVLCRAGERELGRLDELAPLAASGDGFVALLAAPGGDLLLVSRAGEVRRKTAGQAFAPVAILADAIPAPRRGPASAPGRSR